MKKIIWLALSALMLVALFAGCNTGRTVVGTDGVRRDGVRDGYHYRHDGYVTDGGVARGGRHHHPHNRNYRPGGYQYRYDGRVTDTDGIIGNGIDADRPGGRVNNGTVGGGVNNRANGGSTRWAQDGVVTPWSTGRGATGPATTAR